MIMVSNSQLSALHCSLKESQFIELCTWASIATTGVHPLPRARHAAVIVADHYLCIIGGVCDYRPILRDLAILDLSALLSHTFSLSLSLIPSCRYSSMARCVLHNSSR